MPHALFNNKSTHSLLLWEYTCGQKIWSEGAMLSALQKGHVQGPMSSKDLSFDQPLAKDILVIYDEKRDIAKPNASGFYLKKKRHATLHNSTMNIFGTTCQI